MELLQIVGTSLGSSICAVLIVLAVVKQRVKTLEDRRIEDKTDFILKIKAMKLDVKEANDKLELRIKEVDNERKEVTGKIFDELRSIHTKLSDDKTEILEAIAKLKTNNI